MQYYYICQRNLIEEYGMELNHSVKKLTQSERRQKTRASLLASAGRLFGKIGYESTSLDDIADDCGLTIRPIYYHFGSKRELFRAVNELMEERAVEALSCLSAVEAWERFETLCENPDFRRIILVDAPNVLGRERWAGAKALPWCETLAPGVTADKVDMRSRIALAALSEAAMVVAESHDDAAVREAAAQLISTLIPDAGIESQSSQLAQVR
jgi:AcrR family transcriptional regulator